MSYSRNARRRNIRAGGKLPRRPDSTEYRGFWLVTEPTREGARVQAAREAMAARYEAKCAKAGREPSLKKRLRLLGRAS